jgi:single-strand DNA-binding protein
MIQFKLNIQLNNTIMNKVELVGFAGMDPEVKAIGKESKLASFSLATSESYKKDDEWVRITQWHRLVGWNKLADQISDLVKKGKKLSVSGKLTYRTYEDKKGVKRKETEIIVTEVNEAVK